VPSATRLSEVEYIVDGSIYEDNAYYFRGRCYYAQRQYGQAIADFQGLLGKFTGSQYGDNASLYLVRCYVDQNDCANATAAVVQMETDYAGSLLILDARAYAANGGC
jgi:TolA-binding protein